MILMIDNYDSFTFNLVQMLAGLGADVVVKRNDDVDADTVAALAPAGIVVSPGPSHPDRAGNAAAVVRAALGLGDVAGPDSGDAAAPRRIPVLGVCLGHQLVARVFGAEVVRAPTPVHGKTTSVTHDGRGVFANVPNPFPAMRYHSLAVDEATLPPELRVTARGDDGVVMGLRHATLPVEGVQFHPESILTTEGEALLANFVAAASSGHVPGEVAR